MAAHGGGWRSGPANKGGFVVNGRRSQSATWPERPTTPHDYFYAVPDHTDTLPDYSSRARETGQSIAASQPLAHNGRVFWKLTEADRGSLAWLAFSRPDARSPLARRKVWTLIPHLQEFIANWFVSVDHELTDHSQWIHNNINVNEARELALLVPQPSSEDIKRITRPEAVLTLDDIDRHKVTTALGAGTARALRTQR
ncbi:MAG: hypothetical protein WAV90_05915 [Gordonia amarae]